MTNLYTSPVRLAGVGSGAPPVADDGNPIDSMLGSMQTDLHKHGISTIPKGDCAACSKTIVGQVNKADV